MYDVWRVSLSGVTTSLGTQPAKILLFLCGAAAFRQAAAQVCRSCRDVSDTVFFVFMLPPFKLLCLSSNGGTLCRFDSSFRVCFGVFNFALFSGGRGGSAVTFRSLHHFCVFVFPPERGVRLACVFGEMPVSP